jgi:hypothetical protein
MQSDLLLGDLGDQMYHFIHLTLRIFSRYTSENADVIENTPWSTTQHSLYPKTPEKMVV